MSSHSMYLVVAFEGSNRDLVVIGSDSGKVSVVEFDTDKNDWKVVHCEVFGKTGCRRIVPGQYVAADPKGRAILICKPLQSCAGRWISY
jgi:splicing factor 3B subunit 3